MSKTAVTQKIMPTVIFAIEMAFINYKLSPILKAAEIAGERHLLISRRQFRRNSQHQDLVLYISLDIFLYSRAIINFHKVLCRQIFV